MKYCLLLTGHYRSFDETYQNFKNNIIDPNNIDDVYMHTYENLGFRTDLTKDQIIPPNGSLHKATFDQTKIDIDEIKNKYKFKNVVIEDYNIVSEKNSFKERGQKIKDIIVKKFGQDRRIEWIFSQYYKRLKGIEMIIDSEKNYDLIFSTRPDFLIKNEVNLNSMDKEHVYLSRYNHIEGYHDFYLIGTADNLKKIYNIFFHIEKDLCNHVANINVNNITCGHTMLTQFIDNFTDIKIKEIPICGYINRG